MAVPGFSVQQELLQIQHATDHVGFVKIDQDRSKTNFRNELKVSSGVNNQVLLNGSGVSSGDFDQDGLPDLYFCGLESENILYHNRGNFRFTAINSKSLACKDIASTSSIFADLDGDGDLDLIVGTVGDGLIAFINENEHRFSRRNIKLPYAKSLAVYSTPVTDIDQDGDLDIYVATYRSTSIRNSPNLKFELGFSDNQRA